MVAAAHLTTPAVEAYLRHRTGVTAPTTLAWPQRLLRSKWTWLTVVLLLTYSAALWAFVTDIMADRDNGDGSVTPGLNADALWTSFGRALPTLAFWIVCFVLIDRYKPQRALVWLLVVAWGGCAAVTGAYFINNWVGSRMAVVDGSAGTMAIRLAVFVAPFVEEAAKACVIFLIAVMDRNRFTSRVSGAIIGGLAGAGFAFTENIIYYARVIVYGSYTSGAGDVAAFLDYLVYMRGVLTAFGHPMFTMMTGLGVAFALTSRSKIVRVLAPAAGYLLAAFLHMFFNFWMSVLGDQQVVPVVLIGVWPVVILILLRVVMSSVRQGRTVAARLNDYVAMGWLPPTYPAAFSRLRSRAWTVLMSLWHGNVIRTWQLQVRVTELAMLREAITRGTVDASVGREYELVEEIARLARLRGLADGRGLRPYWPWRAARRVRGPALKYSVVDSRWGPPV